MKVAIVGFATEGQVSVAYFQARGHEVTVCDQDASISIPKGVESQLGEDYLDNLDRFDLIVRTAGLPPHVILNKNPEVEPKITTAVDVFLSNCPIKNVIGITGTKGKGTTSTLTTKMLEAAGRKVWLGGNIGVSPLDFIDQVSPNDWVVLELSSFQLMSVKQSPHIAVCLMVVPEHLNWHADMAEYLEAKSNLFRYQQAQDVAIYYAESTLSKQIASTSSGTLLPFYALPGAAVENDTITIDNQTICETSELALMGAHNWQNSCAAITAVWQAGVRDVMAIRSVLTTFTGLEHRIEHIREFEGVHYYDDSFGTTPETAIVALQAFQQPKVIILGGSDKGASYDELANVVARSNVRTALLIGDQASRIQASLNGVGFTNIASGGNTMSEIVKKAREMAEPGDVVLLSTGCASFDMFKDYKDRGNQFQQAVRALE